MYYFIPIKFEQEFAQFIDAWVNYELGWTIITGEYAPKGEIKEGSSLVKNYLPNGQIVEIPYAIGTESENPQILKGFSLEADFTTYPEYETLMRDYKIESFENAEDFLEFLQNN